MTKWDVRFLELAKQIASWSKDPSTQVGCVVVGPDREIRSTGFNDSNADCAFHWTTVGRGAYASLPRTNTNFVASLKK